MDYQIKYQRITTALAKTQTRYCQFETGRLSNFWNFPYFTWMPTCVKLLQLSYSHKSIFSRLVGATFMPDICSIFNTFQLSCTFKNVTMLCYTCTHGWVKSVILLCGTGNSSDHCNILVTFLLISKLNIEELISTIVEVCKMSSHQFLQ